MNGLPVLRRADLETSDRELAEAYALVGKSIDRLRAYPELADVTVALEFEQQRLDSTRRLVAGAYGGG